MVEEKCENVLFVNQLTDSFLVAWRQRSRAYQGNGHINWPRFCMVEAVATLLLTEYTHRWQGECYGVVSLTLCL